MSETRLIQLNVRVKPQTKALVARACKRHALLRDGWVERVLSEAARKAIEATTTTTA